MARYWKKCKFIRESDDESCEVEWKGPPVYNVTESECSAFKDRYEFIGNWDIFMCGFRFKEAVVSDNSTWRCELEKYRNGMGTMEPS